MKFIKGTALALALLITVVNNPTDVASDTPPKPGGVQQASDTPPKPGG